MQHCCLAAPQPAECNASAPAMARQSGGSAARQRGECFVTALRRRRGCDNTAAPRFGKHCTKSMPWRGRGNTETCAANRCCIFSPWGRLSGPLLPDTHPPPKAGPVCLFPSQGATHPAQRLGPDRLAIEFAYSLQAIIVNPSDSYASFLAPPHLPPTHPPKPGEFAWLLATPTHPGLENCTKQKRHGTLAATAVASQQVCDKRKDA